MRDTESTLLNLCKHFGPGAFLLLYRCGARLNFLTGPRKIREPPVSYALPVPVTSNGASSIPTLRTGPDKGQNTGSDGQPKTEFE